MTSLLRKRQLQQHFIGDDLQHDCHIYRDHARARSIILTIVTHILHNLYKKVSFFIQTNLGKHSTNILINAESNRTGCIELHV